MVVKKFHLTCCRLYIIPLPRDSLTRVAASQQLSHRGGESAADHRAPHPHGQTSPLCVTSGPRSPASGATAHTAPAHSNFLSLSSGAGKEDGERSHSAAAYPPPSAPKALSRVCEAWRGGGGEGRERESLRARREAWAEALCGILWVGPIPTSSTAAGEGNGRPGPVRGRTLVPGRRHLCSGLSVAERAPRSYAKSTTFVVLREALVVCSTSSDC